MHDILATQSGRWPEAADIPAWVPDAAHDYLVHTESGLPIRALARRRHCHASTILRQIRRFENRRDDPLVDDALRHLSRHLASFDKRLSKENIDMQPETSQQMTALPPPAETLPSAEQIEREALRVLRRLCETGAVLAVARDMDKAVVVRDTPDAQAGAVAPTRTAVVDRPVAEALALKEWIGCDAPEARIARYHITGAGRAALKRLMAGAGAGGQGFEEAQADFAGHGDAAAQDPTLRHMRATLAESPLNGLARRRDKDGKPFLARDLVAAGERLREDFELSHTGPRVAQDWDRFLTGPAHDSAPGRGGSGAAAAHARVVGALADLGPGLGDVALRCCCYLEGLESLERRMGWSARSGKIVLRIALERLKRHYVETHGRHGPRIG